MNITTQVRETSKGQVVTAKANGKQVTIPTNGKPNKASGEAAAAVALKVKPTGFNVETVGKAKTTDMGKGKRLFVIG